MYKLHMHGVGASTRQTYLYYTRNSFELEIEEQQQQYQNELKRKINTEETMQTHSHNEHDG